MTYVETLSELTVLLKQLMSDPFYVLSHKVEGGKNPLEIMLVFRQSFELEMLSNSLI